MKIGVQTGSLIELLGIKETFRLIGESGFDSVDFSIFYQYPYRDIAEGRPSEFFAKSDEEILEFYRPYKEAARKYNVEFGQAHAPFPSYVGDALTDESVLNAIRKSIMICGYLECRYLIVHPSFLAYDRMLTPEEEWKINIERYSALIEDAKKHDVIICLENMFVSRNGRIYGAICADAHETNRYIDTLNEIAGEKRFAFCLDTGHALLASKELYRLITELGHRIETLHIHDNDGVRDLHMFPYMGIVDWDRFCQGLRDIGYRGHLSFETNGAIHAFDPSLAPELLRLLAATGRLFARRIAG